jgi:RNA polymerase subunit RPABC4/transcription elongation factor Spt4
MEKDKSASCPKCNRTGYIKMQAGKCEKCGVIAEYGSKYCTSHRLNILMLFKLLIKKKTKRLKQIDRKICSVCGKYEDTTSDP